MEGNGSSLRDAWDASAGDWIRWARSNELDHAFWRLNLPALLALMPPPAPTLDVACGEGRVARVLRRHGYDVIGIEGSAALAAAARQADEGFEVIVGDAAAMPFEDSRFDLAVASLCLMNMDDPRAVVAEIARVLKPGGRLCCSLLHPLRTATHAGEAGYFRARRYTETIAGEGATLELNDTHRPLGAYTDALWSAGFAIERLVEPLPDDDHVRDFPSAAQWRQRPGFLHMRAVLRSEIE
jgi:SAM-dependent methyltransferase